MSNYIEKDDFIVVKKHIVMLLFKILRFIVFLIILYISYVFIRKDFFNTKDIEINFIINMLVLIIINYSFIKLILSIIKFFNNLIIVTSDKIFIIKASLIMKDDMEIIDPYRVTKIDVFSHGILSNIIGYGILIIEQQRDSVREFHFIPEPYRIMEVLSKQRDCILEERKRNYIITQ